MLIILQFNSRRHRPLPHGPGNTRFAHLFKSTTTKKEIFDITTTDVNTKLTILLQLNAFAVSHLLLYNLFVIRVIISKASHIVIELYSQLPVYNL